MVTHENPDLGIAEARERRLKILIGREGLELDAGRPARVGPGLAGYEAQTIPGPTGFFIEEVRSEKDAVSGPVHGYEAQNQPAPIAIEGEAVSFL